MRRLSFLPLLVALLASTGCATKIPRDWGSPVPLDTPSALNGSYEDRCVEITGKQSEEVSLVQTMGIVVDYKANIAYSVDVTADEYGLQMVFQRPFEKTAAIRARYSVKKGWLRVSDFDVTVEGGCSGSGIAPCGFLPFGKIERLNLTKTDSGDLLITRTERLMMVFLIPFPETDWALLCKAVPDFDPTSLLPAPALLAASAAPAAEKTITSKKPKPESEPGPEPTPPPTTSKEQTTKVTAKAVAEPKKAPSAKQQPPANQAPTATQEAGEKP